MSANYIIRYPISNATTMAPVQIACSIVLLVISLGLAGVLLAGTASSDCDVTSEVPWGVFEMTTTLKADPTVPVTFSMKTYMAGRQFCDDLDMDTTDDDDWDDDSNSSSESQDDDDEGDDPMSAAVNSCRDAGNVSHWLTIALFVLTVLAIVFTVARIKAASIILTILAIGCDIAAIGHFDHKCLTELDDMGSSMAAAAAQFGLADVLEVDVDVKHSVGIYAGSVMVFLLTLSVVLNAVVPATTRKNPEHTPGGPLMREGGIQY